MLAESVIRETGQLPEKEEDKFGVDSFSEIFIDKVKMKLSI